MTYSRTKKHYRAAQKACCAPAPAASGKLDKLIAAKKDFLTEYGPLLVVILAAVSLALDLISFGINLAKKADKSGGRAAGQRAGQ
ncbi:MAG: hypothetical protein FWF44_07360 [Defluviitaleaceae bacterium]|nr:hypothetical protein [Defluviitaleaceae bacterium]